ncbi:hypothetical protein T484DRAFT_1837210, partial [Baffinella frigidus]
MSQPPASDFSLWMGFDEDDSDDEPAPPTPPRVDFPATAQPRGQSGAGAWDKLEEEGKEDVGAAEGALKGQAGARSRAVEQERAVAQPAEEGRDGTVPLVGGGDAAPERSGRAAEDPLSGAGVDRRRRFGEEEEKEEEEEEDVDEDEEDAE